MENVLMFVSIRCNRKRNQESEEGEGGEESISE